MAEHTHTSEIGCSLTDEQFRERRALAHESLLPHLVGMERFESGLKLTFPETDRLRSRVESFVGLERQCCGFLTFTIAPPGEGLKIRVEGPPEAQATLEMLAAAFATAR